MRHHRFPFGMKPDPIWMTYPGDDKYDCQRHAPLPPCALRYPALTQGNVPRQKRSLLHCVSLMHPGSVLYFHFHTRSQRSGKLSFYFYRPHTMRCIFLIHPLSHCRSAGFPPLQSPIPSYLPDSGQTLSPLFFSSAVSAANLRPSLKRT